MHRKKIKYKHLKVLGFKRQKKNYDLTSNNNFCKQELKSFDTIFIFLIEKIHAQNLSNPFRNQNKICFDFKTKKSTKLKEHA